MESLSSDSSSVHEVLLLVDDGSYVYHELSLMVRSINEKEVEREDRLSSCVYCLYNGVKTLAF